MSDVADDTSMAEDEAQLIQINYMRRRVVISWVQDLEAFKSTIRHLFDIPQQEDLRLFTERKEGARRKENIDSWNWSELENQISTVWVAAPELNRPTGTPDLTIELVNGERFPIVMENFPTAVVGDLKRLIQDQEGIPCEWLALYAEGPAETRLQREKRNRPSPLRALWKHLLGFLRCASPQVRVAPPEEPTDTVYERYIQEEGFNIFKPYTLEYHKITRGSTLFLKISPPVGLFRFTLPSSSPIVPIPTPTPAPAPSRPAEIKLFRLHYKERLLMTKWNSNFEEFQKTARQVFAIPQEHRVAFSVQLKGFGEDKMEVDPTSWRMMKRDITEVWLSDVASESSKNEGGEAHQA